MAQFPEIKKRSGEIVPFDANKIHIAITKAFIDVKGKTEDSLVRPISDHVINHIQEKFKDRVPSVEDVQNTVEQVLMEQGFFPVAKSYIIYRYEHAKVREEKKQEMLKKIEEEGLYVVKRSGEREAFSPEKLRRSIQFAAQGVEKDINIDAIVAQCRIELHEDMKTSDITKALIMVLRSFIEQDPAYSKVAARILLAKLNKSIIGSEEVDFARIDDQLRVAFIDSIQKGVSLGRLDPRLLTFDLSSLAKKLDFTKDNLLDFMAMQTLHDRYFIQDPSTKHIFENPQIFWMRVAMGLALAEAPHQRNMWAEKFYNVLCSLRYTPSTPTLFHAGTNHPQMSSCYLNTVEDSLEHIFKVYGDNAQLSKWSGGIGTDWTNLRGTAALIHGTGVESQGVIPFLKISNDVTVAINRSGKRRGAACVYLEVWHWDIEDFMELRKNTGDERRRTHDMDTAMWIPDLFMERVQNDGDWTLFSPEETPDLHHIYGKEFKIRYEQYEEKAKRGEIRLHKTIKAKDLWKKAITMLFETGHPWITWKDPSNVRSPQDHMGVVHNSNLCTEITLNNSAEETAVCNLGSINIARHINAQGVLDQGQLQETTTLAMRMLDNVVDLNFYPTKEAKTSNLRHRPVGLGIMGTQDALYKLNLPFDSEEAVRFSDNCMEAISYYSILASSQLAAERGKYQSYKGSKWDRGLFPIDTIALLEQERGKQIPVDRNTTMDWNVVRESVRLHGMRNSNCMAIAPTATISTINGSVPSIEPIYKNIYVKSNQTGEFIIVNEHLVHDLKKLGLWDFEMLGKIKYHDGNIREILEIPQDIREKYKETFDIDPRWCIQHAARRGKWIDQSQSLNIFYGGKSGKDLNDIYFYAWEMGIKTTYYLRTLGASQVEKSTVSTAEFGSTHNRKDFLKSVNEAPELPPVMMSIPAVEPEKVPVRPMPLPEQVANMTLAEKEAAARAAGVKICRLDDPTCESCQ